MLIRCVSLFICPFRRGAVSAPKKGGIRRRSVARVGGASGVAPAAVGIDLRLAPAGAPVGPLRRAHLAIPLGINLPQAGFLAWAHFPCAWDAKQRIGGQGVFLALQRAVDALLLLEQGVPLCAILVAEFFSTVMRIYKGIEVGG